MSPERLARTTGQVAHYQLPEAPDSGDTELDTLEALHPGELEASSGKRSGRGGIPA